MRTEEERLRNKNFRDELRVRKAQARYEKKRQRGKEQI